MSYEITWLRRAELTFAQNIGYLSRRWGPKVVKKYLDKVDEVLERIAHNPQNFPVFKHKRRIYKVVIHKRIILYFRIFDDNNVDLLVFWNTYRNPSKLRL